MPVNPTTIGRPLKFRSAIELERKIIEYLNDCEGRLTFTGLAVHLGMTRKMLIEYGERETFRDVINGAKAIIESKVEELLLYSKQSPAGLIFWLKNQGWKDVSQVDVNELNKLSREELLEKVKSITSLASFASQKPLPNPAKQAA